MSRAPVLFIGGMDSSGGAGLMRDAATAAALKTPARLAVTAVTAQGRGGVKALHPIPARVLIAQIRAAGDCAAVKIGMLARASLVRALAKALTARPLVIDPVLAASAGGELLDDAGRLALCDLLLPRCDLLTPNLPELSMLASPLGLPPDTPEPAIAAAILERGCRAVLVKGGHRAPDQPAEDRLYRPDAPPVSFASPRLNGTARGTGCELASAIAVHLSNGVALEPAIALARERVRERIAAGG